MYLILKIFVLAWIFVQSAGAKSIFGYNEAVVGGFRKILETKFPKNPLEDSMRSLDVIFWTKALLRVTVFVIIINLFSLGCLLYFYPILDLKMTDQGWFITTGEKHA